MITQRIGIKGIEFPQAQRAGNRSSSEGFGAILKKVSEGITVSAHAKDRIASRNIPFGNSEVSRIESALQKAEAKGSRDALMLLDGNAFVVSVTNRTIVTAMDGMNVRDNVFTNIDSAVIA